MDTFRAAITLPDLPLPPQTRLVVFPGAEVPVVRSRNSDDFLHQAADFAQKAQVFVVPGLYVQEEQLCLSLLDPQGHLVLEQPATHLNPTWAGDLRRGDTISVYDAPFGRLAFCVDVDVFKPEVARIAALQGAEVIINCQVLRPEDPRRELILAGAWQQAQQNCLYLLTTTPYEATIIGPCEVVEDHSGFLTPISNQYPLQAELSEEKRAAAYRSFPIFKSMNPALYRRHARELGR